MNRYLISMVFRIGSETEKVAQFDEQVRVVKAESPGAAYEKALYMGMAEEGPVNNINGTVLHWTFVGITRLMALKNLPDRSEIFSSTREVDWPQGFVQHVKEKQEAIILSLKAYQHGEITV